MTGYCYNLLIDTAIVLIYKVTMHACTFITLVDNYTLPAYSYNLLINTVIVIINIVIMRACTFITLVDNIMCYNLFGFQSLMPFSYFHLSEWQRNLALRFISSCCASGYLGYFVMHSKTKYTKWSTSMENVIRH
jgi:hypothetical protein